MGNLQIPIICLALVAVVLALLIARPAMDLSPRNSKTIEQSTAAANAWLPGIDVSHYQGRVDWPAVKKAGIEFVYLKATDGVDYIDPKLTSYSEALETLGLRAGAYHFFEPGDDPEAQARHFLRTIRQHEFALPPVLDAEITRGKTPAEIKASVKRWLHFVKDQTHCAPMIYTNRAYWNQYLGAEFAAYPIWLADYAEKPGLPEGVARWRFWQHSRNGRVGGIDVRVDLDWFAGTQAQMNDIGCREQ